jgi:hypothetical protein
LLAYIYVLICRKYILIPDPRLLTSRRHTLKRKTHGNRNIVASGAYYGYTSDEEPSHSLRWVLRDKMGLMPNKALDALRYLGVLSDSPFEKNKPTSLYIDSGFFQFKRKVGPYTGYTPRITVAGWQYLKELVAANPDLFPPKDKSKVKKLSASQNLYALVFFEDLVFNERACEYEFKLIA